MEYEMEFGNTSRKRSRSRSRVRSARRGKNGSREVFLRFKEFDNDPRIQGTAYRKGRVGKIVVIIIQFKIKVNLKKLTLLVVLLYIKAHHQNVQDHCVVNTEDDVLGLDVVDHVELDLVSLVPCIKE